MLLTQATQPQAHLLPNCKSDPLRLSNSPANSITVAPEKGVHAQFRRLRMTLQGTYLVPFLQMHRVVEYDQNF